MFLVFSLYITFICFLFKVFCTLSAWPKKSVKKTRRWRTKYPSYRYKYRKNRKKKSTLRIDRVSYRNCLLQVGTFYYLCFLYILLFIRVFCFPAVDPFYYFEVFCYAKYLYTDNYSYIFVLVVALLYKFYVVHFVLFLIDDMCPVLFSFFGSSITKLARFTMFLLWICPGLDTSGIVLNTPYPFVVLVFLLFVFLSAGFYFLFCLSYLLWFSSDYTNVHYNYESTLDDEYFFYRAWSSSYVYSNILKLLRSFEILTFVFAFFMLITIFIIFWHVEPLLFFYYTSSFFFILLTWFVSEGDYLLSSLAGFFYFLCTTCLLWFLFFYFGWLFFHFYSKIYGYL